MKLGNEDYAVELISRCEQYLTGMGCVLWGQYFDITDEKQRHSAAEWLAEAIDGVAWLVTNSATAHKLEVQIPALTDRSRSNGKRKPICLAARSKHGSIECQQAYGHKGDHAAQGKNGRWYTWK